MKCKDNAHEHVNVQGMI